MKPWIFIGLVPFTIICWTHFFVISGVASTIALIALALALPALKKPA